MKNLIYKSLVVAVGPLVLMAAVVLSSSFAQAQTCKVFEGAPSHCPAEEETATIECATQECYKNNTSSDRNFASAMGKERPEYIEKILRDLSAGQTPRDEGKSEESDR